MLSFEDILSFSTKTVCVIASLFLLFALVMYLNQNSLIFPTSVNGMKYPEDNPDPYKSPLQLGLDYQEVSTTTSDGVKLVGWLVYKSDTPPRPTMLYFHENAGSKIYNI